MITSKTLKLSLKSLKDFAKKRLPDEKLLELDDARRVPAGDRPHMCSPDKLGIQLLFIPEEFGGMGGGAFDVYCVCEEMARIDLGVATAVLATFLGSDPITVGATPEQKKIWLTRIAEEGLLFAYGATEPEAGSDLGALAPRRTASSKDGTDRRLQNQWQQAMDQQRWNRRCLHGSSQHARRSELVHRRERRQGIHSRRTGRQARHSPQQHRGARASTTYTSMPTG